MASTPRRSIRAATLALALCLLALTPATGTAAGAATARRAAEPVSSSLRIATYNVSAGLPVARTVRDLREIVKDSPDVISLQEMASWKRRQAVRKAFVDCDTCAYDAHVPGPAVPGGTPILYRSDRYTLLEKGSEKVTEDTRVGERGAGPSTIRAKWSTGSGCATTPPSARCTCSTTTSCRRCRPATAAQRPAQAGRDLPQAHGGARRHHRSRQEGHGRNGLRHG